MAVPVQSRWWIATLVIILVLVLISALALDQPDVVWTDAKPHCPSCRSEVRPYSHRCAACGSEFDWVVAADEESPICEDGLSVLDAEWLRERAKALGPERSAEIVAAAAGISKEAADAYVHSVGRGDCGWCGGTRKDLGSTVPVEDAGPCPACLGTGRCVGCGGDRRVRIGDQSAARGYAAYLAELRDLDLMSGPTPAEAKRAEAQRLAERFLSFHAGTPQAQHILFWPQAVRPAEGPGEFAFEAPTVTGVCRGRLRAILEAFRQAQ